MVGSEGVDGQYNIWRYRALQTFACSNERWLGDFPVSHHDRTASYCGWISVVSNIYIYHVRKFVGRLRERKLKKYHKKTDLTECYGGYIAIDFVQIPWCWIPIHVPPLCICFGTTGGFQGLFFGRFPCRKDNIGGVMWRTMCKYFCKNECK